MKFLIEYSGGRPNQVWNGTITIEAEDAAQAIRQIENEIACIPASIYAVNPHEEETTRTTKTQGIDAK
jgi:hypothetical protein